MLVNFWSAAGIPAMLSSFICISSLPAFLLGEVGCPFLASAEGNLLSLVNFGEGVLCALLLSFTFSFVLALGEELFL